MTFFRFGRPATCVPACFALFLGFSSSPLAVAQEQDIVPVEARISQTISDLSLVTLRGNTPPQSRLKNDLGPAPAAKVADRLILVLSRSAAQEASLQTWMDSVQDANSPNYRKWVTPDQFGKRFGVSDADLASVTNWLRGQGFSVNKVSPGRMSIEFSGTTAQVQTAFHTSIHSYLVEGVQHWSNATDPQIPAALAPVVAGVARLNDFNPRSNAVRGPSGIYDPDTRRIEPAYTRGSSTNGFTVFLGPADAATIYDTPTTLNASHSGTLYDGTGVTIGIAGDSNIDVSQNAHYRATFGLPVKATTVVVDGDDPGENGDAIEAYLDTEVATGIAPNANIVLYTAANTYLNAGLFLAIARAVDDNQVDILNISFGGCEAHQGASGNQYIYNLWQQAAAQGISLTVSTGDSGSAGCDNPNAEYQASQGLAVNALASTPYNIAVGGTDFDVLYSAFPTSFTQYIDVTNSLANHRSALKYIPERPWNDSTFQGDNSAISGNVPWTATPYNNANIVAAGGGVSACVVKSAGSCSSGYPVPGWQSTIVGSTTGRILPDISLLAGNGLYGAIWGLCTDQDYDSAQNKVTDCAGNPTSGANFNLTGVGGTSASAPAFAGMLALLKQKVGTRLGQANYVLYDLAKSHYATIFHDVQTGNNSVACQSGTPDCAANTGNYYFMTGYNAGTGFDEASGLGSVDASQMLSNWASAGLTATNSSLTLNSSTAALNIVHGTSVAVSVGVTGSGGSPAGDVALVDSINPATVPNSGSIGSFALTSGTAAGTINSLPGGSYNVSAHYGGSSIFASSDSNSIPVTVSAESSTTSLTVRGYYDPETGQSAATPYYGFIYLLDAQPYGQSASAANPDGAATGTISFKSGTATIGTAGLASDGIAELQTETLPAGANSLTASFSGDPSFLASTSSPVSLTVQPGITGMQLATSAQFYNVGDSVTIKATFIDPSGNKHLDSVGAAPTGTVTFMDGNNALGTVPINASAGSSTSYVTGSASYTTTKLGLGGHNLTAVYNGDANYGASINPPFFNIYLFGANPKISVVPAVSTIKINQSLQATVTVGGSGSLPVPTGTVSLIVQYQDMSIIYSSPAATISNGTATITIPANSLALGSLVLRANYSGDANYYPDGASVPIQVNSSGTVTPNVSLTLPTGSVNGAFPLTVKVSGPSGDPVPTGVVMLTGSVFITYPLVNGSASTSYGFGLPPGPNTLTATYLGDTTYTGGTGTGIVNEIAPANLTLSPVNPTVAVNQSLPVTVTVATAANVATPTGTVTLSSGAYTSSAVALVSGTASIAIPANSLAEGSSSLLATYSGDNNYLPGTISEVVTVTAPAAPGLTLSGTNVTLASGATSGNTSKITVAPTGGFTGSVTLTAAVTSSPAGAVHPPTLSFGTTSPVTISDASSKTATLTISTTAPVTASLAPSSTHGLPVRAGATALACLLLFGMGAIRRRGKSMLLMLLLLVLAGGVMSCGGGGGSPGGGGGGNTSPGTTTGNYVLTVTAASGSVVATTTVILTVH